MSNWLAIVRGRARFSRPAASLQQPRQDAVVVRQLEFAHDVAGHDAEEVGGEEVVGDDGPLRGGHAAGNGRQLVALDQRQTTADVDGAMELVAKDHVREAAAEVKAATRQRPRRGLPRTAGGR